MPHHTTRRADSLKHDRERQKKRRDDLKELGAPTTHILNRALAEGFLYWLDAGRAQGLPIQQINVSSQDVLVYATNVLTRGTNGTDRYDRTAVTDALKKRIRRKSPSKFRIAPAWREHDGHG